jgi:hypothetical protein
MNIIEIATLIFDLLKLTFEVIATMFLIEQTYMTWLDKLKPHGSQSKNLDF